MEPKRLTSSKRFVDLPEDVLARILGNLDQLKDRQVTTCHLGLESTSFCSSLPLECLLGNKETVSHACRVCAVSCNRQLAALGKSCTRLWEEVEFPVRINPGTAAVWLAAKRSTVHKVDLRRPGAVSAIYLLAALARGVTEELSIRLSELSTFNPQVLQLPRLRKLSISGGYVSGVGLEGSFSHLRHLTSLHLSEVSWCAEESLVLGALAELQDLTCTGHSDFFDAILDLSGLSLTSLTLSLARTDVAPEALLPAMPALEQLSVRWRAASRLASTVNWVGFTQLRSLTLSEDGHVEEPLDLVPVIGLPQLEVLDVGDCTLRHLPNLGLGMPIMARLQRLTVNDAWLSNNLAWLDCLPYLKVLHLTRGSLGLFGACDAQWEMLLESLTRALPSLKSLEVDAYDMMAGGGNGEDLRKSFEFLLSKRPELYVFGY